MSSQPCNSGFSNNEQRLLYIDPFLLDRRNYNPDDDNSAFSIQAPQDYNPDAPVAERHFTATVPSAGPSSQNEADLEPEQASGVSVSHIQPSTPQWACDGCPKTFEKRSGLSNHKKTHRRRFICQDPSCAEIGFAYRKDFERHKESKHPDTVDGFQRSCAVPGCKSNVFRRMDNFRRHMRTQHPGVQF